MLWSERTVPDSLNFECDSILKNLRHGWPAVRRRTPVKGQTNGGNE
jgi:hypothetical protein